MEQYIEPEHQSAALDSTLPDEDYRCDNCGQFTNKSLEYCDVCGSPLQYNANYEKANTSANSSITRSAPYPNVPIRPAVSGDSVENIRKNQMGAAAITQKKPYPAYSGQRNINGYNNKKPPALENKLSGGTVAWIIICVVVHSVLGILSAVFMIAGVGIGIMTLSALTSFGAVAGYILIYTRKKPGLYVVIGCAAITIILNIIILNNIAANILLAVFGFLSPLITWLLTRKLWDPPQRVDNTVYQNINRTQTPRQPQQTPKAPPPATTYQRSGGDAILRASTGKYFCPSCNADLGPAINREAGAIYEVFKNMGAVGGLVTMDTARNKLIYEQGITCSCGKTLKPYKKSAY